MVFSSGRGIVTAGVAVVVAVATVGAPVVGALDVVVGNETASSVQRTVVAAVDAKTYQGSQESSGTPLSVGVSEPET